MLNRLLNFSFILNFRISFFFLNWILSCLLFSPLLIYLQNERRRQDSHLSSLLISTTHYIPLFSVQCFFFCFSENSQTVSREEKSFLEKLISEWECKHFLSKYKAEEGMSFMYVRMWRKKKCFIKWKKEESWFTFVFKLAKQVNTPFFLLPKLKLINFRLISKWSQQNKIFSYVLFAVCNNLVMPLMSICDFSSATNEILKKDAKQFSRIKKAKGRWRTSRKVILMFQWPRSVRYDKFIAQSFLYQFT